MVGASLSRTSFRSFLIAGVVASQGQATVKAPAAVIALPMTPLAGAASAPAPVARSPIPGLTGGPSFATGVDPWPSIRAEVASLRLPLVSAPLAARGPFDPAPSASVGPAVMRARSPQDATLLLADRASAMALNAGRIAAALGDPRSDEALPQASAARLDPALPSASALRSAAAASVVAGEDRVESYEEYLRSSKRLYPDNFQGQVVESLGALGLGAAFSYLLLTQHLAWAFAALGALYLYGIYREGH